MRARFAPSPTGTLHVGNARIAVLNWLFTRRHGGAFVLRIEDTDAARNVPGAEQRIRDDLRWLGLDWDEGPDDDGGAPRGDHGPYRQSERGPVYRAYAERLKQAGAVYQCFCTPPDHATQAAAGSPSDTSAVAADTSAVPADTSAVPADPAVRGGARSATSAVEQHGTTHACAGVCRDLVAADAQERSAGGEASALRFRVRRPDAVTFADALRGNISVSTEEIADFVVQRSDGTPTYNFAVVVDDIEMAITHVLRGSGHLSNTPRQVLLFDALGAPRPVFVHVPMVLGPDRQKLSKRHGAQGVTEYRAQGYHPDALVNYLSLLSWSSESGDEVLSRDRLLAEISLDRMGAADVVFDPVKLRWLSGKHFEQLEIGDLVRAVEPFLDRARFDLPPALLAAAVAGVRSHIAVLSDINAQLATYYPDAALPALPASAVPVLEAAGSALGRTGAWTEPDLAAALREAAAAAGVKGRSLYQPLRLALTGTVHGPPFTTVLLVQGKVAVLERLTTVTTAMRQAGAGQ